MEYLTLAIQYFAKPLIGESNDQISLYIPNSFVVNVAMRMVKSPPAFDDVTKKINEAIAMYSSSIGDLSLRLGVKIFEKAQEVQSNMDFLATYVGSRFDDVERAIQNSAGIGSSPISLKNVSGFAQYLWKVTLASENRRKVTKSS